MGEILQVRLLRKFYASKWHVILNRYNIASAAERIQRDEITVVQRDSTGGSADAMIIFHNPPYWARSCCNHVAYSAARVATMNSSKALEQILDKGIAHMIISNAAYCRVSMLSHKSCKGVSSLVRRSKDLFGDFSSVYAQPCWGTFSFVIDIVSTLNAVGKSYLSN